MLSTHEVLSAPHRCPSGLTPRSPVLLRLWAYVQERFPLGSTALVVVAFFAAGISCVQAATARGPLKLAPAHAAGALGLVLVFFRLRLFDEQKDSDRDLRAHPERLLSRGVVTLPLLFRVLVTVLILEALLYALIGGWPFVTWLLVLGYSVAMRFEFGASAYLERRPALYAVTHMAITPLMALHIVSFLGADAVLTLSSARFVVLASLCTVTFEVGRKVFAPGEEHPFQDSYSKLLGPKKAALAVGLVSASASAIALRWAAVLSLPLAAWAVLVAAAASVLCAASLYFVHPTPAAAKAVKLTTSLQLLLQLASLAAFTLASRGLA